MKSPTQKEKIAVYESILHDLHFYSCVSLDKDSMHKTLDLISNWSYSHRQGNGELSDKEQKDIINKAFNKLKRENCE